MTDWRVHDWDLLNRLLGSHQVWQLVSGYASHVNVNLLGLKQFSVLRIVSLWVRDEFLQFSEELASGLAQVDLREVLAGRSIVRLDSDPEVVGVVNFKSSLGGVAFVVELIALRVRPELKAVVQELPVEGLQVSQQSWSNLGLYVPFPFPVGLLILRQNLDLNEVLVGLEERELLEQALPGNLLSAVVLHKLLGDFHGFLQFGDHHVPSGQTHVVGRIHARVGWCDDRKEVSSLVGLVAELLLDFKAGHPRVVLNFSQHHGVVVLPNSVPVVSEEGVQKLACLKLRVLFADIRNQDRPGYSSAVPKHVRVDASVLGPQFDASKGQLEGLDVRDMAQDCVGGSASIQAFNAVVVAVSEDGDVVEAVQVVSDFLQLDSGK